MTTNDEHESQHDGWSTARKWALVVACLATTVLAAVLMVLGHISEGSLIAAALISAAGTASATSASRR